MQEEKKEKSKNLNLRSLMQENKDGYRPNVAMVVINSEKKGIDLSKKEYKNMAISSRGYR